MKKNKKIIAAAFIFIISILVFSCTSLPEVDGSYTIEEDGGVNWTITIKGILGRD